MMARDKGVESKEVGSEDINRRSEGEGRSGTAGAYYGGKMGILKSHVDLKKRPCRMSLSLRKWSCRLSLTRNSHVACQ